MHHAKNDAAACTRRKTQQTEGTPLICIVAVDEKWGIGANGTQTAVIPEDRRRFKALTDGGTVIVGHRTLLDFPGGKPLAGRRNIVMSRDKSLRVDGATVVTTLKELFDAVAGEDPDRVFVLGGGSVFKLLLPYCNAAHVTRILATTESDTFFPNLDELENWVLEEAGETKSHGGIPYVFQKYRNISPLPPPTRAE